MGVTLDAMTWVSDFFVHMLSSTDLFTVFLRGWYPGWNNLVAPLLAYH